MGFSLLESGLLSDAVESPGREFVARLAGNGHASVLARMLELVMTPASRDDSPSHHRIAAGGFRWPSRSGIMRRGAPGAHCGLRIQANRRAATDAAQQEATNRRPVDRVVRRHVLNSYRYNIAVPVGWMGICRSQRSRRRSNRPASAAPTCDSLGTRKCIRTHRLA
jgi:hypothetical protein